MIGGRKDHKELGDNEFSPSRNRSELDTGSDMPKDFLDKQNSNAVNFKR